MGGNRKSTRHFNLVLFPYLSEIKPAIPFTNRYFGFNLCRFWCTRQELNLHGVNHKILSLARLPIPPRVLYLKHCNFILFYLLCQVKFGAKINLLIIFFYFCQNIKYFCFEFNNFVIIMYDIILCKIVIFVI